MKTSSLVVLLCLAGGLAGAAQPAFSLFSAAEAAQWNRSDQPPAFTPRELTPLGVPSCRSLPDAAARTANDPRINIVAPALDKPLSPPLDIEVQFVAGGPAIRPETFRVCYVGFLTIDITKRITEHVSVSAQGLHVSGADLPRGHHHLMMLIADAQGHLGARDATFDIR